MIFFNFFSMINLTFSKFFINMQENFIEPEAPLKIHLTIKFFNKSWYFFSNAMSLFLITIFIICLGIFFSKKASHIKIFNLIIGFYLIIYFFFSSLNYAIIFNNLNWSFNQNITLFANLFIFLATLTTLIFLGGISNVFFSEENTKIEFSLLVWFIYISSVFLITNTDFISTILLLECIAFSSYILVGFERKNKFSTVSALKYLILASIPSGLFILGLTLFYNLFGSFSQDYLLLILQTFVENNSSLYNLTHLSFKDWIFLDKQNKFAFDAAFSNYIQELNFFLMIRKPTYVYDIVATEHYLIKKEFPKVLAIASQEILDAKLKLDEIAQSQKITNVQEKVSEQLIQEKVKSSYDFLKKCPTPDTFNEKELSRCDCTKNLDSLKSSFDKFKERTIAKSDAVNFYEENLKQIAAKTSEELALEIMQRPEYASRWSANHIFRQYSVDLMQLHMVLRELFIFKYMWNLKHYSDALVWADHVTDKLPYSFSIWEYAFLQKFQGILKWMYFLNWNQHFSFQHMCTISDKKITVESLIKTSYEHFYEYHFKITFTGYGIYIDNYRAWIKCRRVSSLFEKLEPEKMGIFLQLLANIKDKHPEENLNKFIYAIYPLSFKLTYLLKKFSLEELIDAYTQMRYMRYEQFFLPTTLLYFKLNKFEFVYYYDYIILPLFLAILFILGNLCFKLTAAPFGTWAPSVYGGSPLAVLTFLSIFSKLTVMFLTIWLFLNVFDVLQMFWQSLFLMISFLSIFQSILGAFSEKIFKRFFVYSSMGHVGFMLIGIGVFNFEGLKGSIDYLIIYILSSFIIWFIILHLKSNTKTLINLKGLSFNYPELSIIFSFVVFSFSGIPPLAGFFVKYEIFYSILNSSLFYLGYLLLGLTVVSFFYYLRLIKIIFFEKNNFFYKNKNLEDIKLRIISFSFFIIPFYLIYIQTPVGLILKEILIKSIF